MLGDRAHIQLRRPKCGLLLTVPGKQCLEPSCWHVHTIVGMPTAKAGPHTGSTQDCAYPTHVEDMYFMTERTKRHVHLEVQSSRP